MKTLQNKTASKWVNTVFNVFLSLTLTALVANCSGSDDDSSDSSEEATTTTTKTSSSIPSGYSQASDSSVSLSVQGSTAGAALLATALTVKGSDGSAAGTLTLDVAKIVLDKIKFKFENDEAESDNAVSASSDGDENVEAEEDESLQFKGPYIVDLLTNTMTPEPLAIDVPAGNYKHIELSMHKVEREESSELGIGEADPLYENSVYVSGTYTPTGGSAVNFAMTYDLSEKFLLAGASGMDIAADAVNGFVIAFRPSSWFDFSNVETNSDGVNLSDLPAGDININKDSEDVADKIQDIIKNNIKESADFGKDNDGDGELSNDEDSESDEEEDEEGEEE